MYKGDDRDKVYICEQVFFDFALWLPWCGLKDLKGERIPNSSYGINFIFSESFSKSQ